MITSAEIEGFAMAFQTEKIHDNGDDTYSKVVRVEGLVVEADSINLDTTDLETAVSAAETTNTPAAVVLSSSTAANLLAASASRIRASIYNPLATPLYVRKATLAASPATAVAGGYDFVVPSGYAWTSDPFEWAGGYNGICATAGSVNVSQAV